MPPIATARGMPRAARLAAVVASLAAELFQRRFERTGVVELLRLPLARGAAQAASGDLERQVLHRRGGVHAIEAAIQVDDPDDIAKLRLELRLVHILQGIAALAQPEFRVGGAAA